MDDPEGSHLITWTLKNKELSLPGRHRDMAAGDTWDSQSSTETQLTVVGGRPHGKHMKESEQPLVAKTVPSKETGTGIL